MTDSHSGWSRLLEGPLLAAQAPFPYDEEVDVAEDDNTVVRVQP